MLAETVLGFVAMFCIVLLGFLCLRKKKVERELPIYVQIEAHSPAQVLQTGEQASNSHNSPARASQSSTRLERSVGETTNKDAVDGNDAFSRSAKQTDSIRLKQTSTNEKSPYEILDDQRGIPSTDRDSSRSFSLSRAPSRGARLPSANVDAVSTSSRAESSRKRLSRTERADATSMHASTGHQIVDTNAAPPPLPDRNYRPDALLDELQMLPEHEYAVIDSTNAPPSGDSRMNRMETQPTEQESQSSMQRDGSYGYERIGLRRASDVAIAAEHGVVFATQAGSSGCPYVGIAVRESIASLQARNALPVFNMDAQAQLVYGGSIGSDYAQLNDVAISPSEAAPPPTPAHLVEVAPGYFSTVNKPRRPVSHAEPAARAVPPPRQSLPAGFLPSDGSWASSPYDEVDERSPPRLGIDSQPDDPYVNASDVEADPNLQQACEDSVSGGYVRINSVRAHLQRTRDQLVPVGLQLESALDTDTDAVGYETIEAMQALQSGSNSLPDTSV